MDDAMIHYGSTNIVARHETPCGLRFPQLHGTHFEDIACPDADATAILYPDILRAFSLAVASAPDRTRVRLAIKTSQIRGISA
ncbi:hypothetical protein [Dyella mobilis]|uniref:Uncharacterized protein n=1 Tax=Dyella mobilis TaxID=1849582 RepID=A0ABS2KBT8_9GAMM|nr:hypothetical protein [Dyella mobilis]MBM7128655.1 hypothetical protein [Dyella mobilis]GLQ99440.1 hypothetical protein GCM10007863_38600 [Dyella mobilis]